MSPFLVALGLAAGGFVFVLVLADGLGSAARTRDRLDAEVPAVGSLEVSEEPAVSPWPEPIVMSPRQAAMLATRLPERRPRDRG